MSVFDPIAVDQGPGASDVYPFSGPTVYSGLVSDLYLAYRDDECETMRPFRLVWLYGVGAGAGDEPSGGAEHAADALLQDAGDAVVIDTRVDGTDYDVYDWTGRFRIHTWINENAGWILRIAAHDGDEVDEPPDSYSIYLQDVEELAWLDARTCEQERPRVRSIRVEDGDQYVDALALTNGWNTEWEVEQLPAVDGGRTQTILTLHAGPGDGDGKFGPACTDDAYEIRTINGVAPDESGNFFIDATGCTHLTRPLFVAEPVEVQPDPPPSFLAPAFMSPSFLSQSFLSPALLSPGTGLGEGGPEATTPAFLSPAFLSVAFLDGFSSGIELIDHTLKLLDGCTQCCTCDDYINTYEGVRRLRNLYADLTARAAVVRDLYAENVERFNAQAVCRAADPLRIAVQPNCPDELVVVIGYCNNTEECLHNIVVPISFAYSDLAGDTEPGSDDPLTAVTSYSGEDPPTFSCTDTFREGDASVVPVPGTVTPPRQFYQLGGTYPNVYALWESINPGTMATVSFRIRFADSEAADRVEMIVDAYRGAPAPTGIGEEVFPVPGYTIGGGPTSPEALALRLVTTPKKVVSGLLQTCCEDA